MADLLRLRPDFDYSLCGLTISGLSHEFKQFTKKFMKAIVLAGFLGIINPTERSRSNRA